MTNSSYIRLGGDQYGWSTVLLENKKLYSIKIISQNIKKHTKPNSGFVPLLLVICTPDNEKRLTSIMTGLIIDSELFTITDCNNEKNIII